jgi:hypothetical protein
MPIMVNSAVTGNQHIHSPQIPGQVSRSQDGALSKTVGVFVPFFPC